MSPSPLTLQVGPRRIELAAVDDLVSVTYDDALSTADRKDVEREVLGSPPRRRYEVPGHRITVVGVESPDPGLPRARPWAQRLNAMNAVEVSRVLFRYGDLRVAIGFTVLVKTRDPGADPSVLLKERGLTVIQRCAGAFVCAPDTGIDPVAAAEALMKEAWVAYAEADLVSMGTQPRPAESSASSLGSSPALQPGLQMIGAIDGWSSGGARSDVRVAILDDGAQLNHPAISSSIAASYDAINDSDFLVTNPWDTHGTACAALACGRDDAVGFRGVADGCSLLIARIASTPAPQAAWSTSSLIIARGIDWASQRGADVLSNSWGGGAPSNLVVDALASARTRGRDRLGCVIVQAAGNNAGPVLFPANLDGALAVSGVNLNDEFKTPNSSDGETWWGSCHGPEVDIAAPCVALRTADTMGPYGAAPGDYYDRFNGTSAATPLVAGAAALLIGLRPQLAEADVRSVLCSTAAKVGRESYFDGRNEQLGSGRLNLTAAIQFLRGSGSPVREETRAVPVAVVDPLRVRSGLVRLPWPALPIYCLETANGTLYLLQALGADDPTTLRMGLAANAAVFARLEGKAVRVSFDSDEVILNRHILWKASVEEQGPTTSGPAANEVLLPDPASDVFR